MIRRKDNRLQQLAIACNRENRKRNLILTFAIALTVFVLFSAFSIAKGKVIIDSIKIIRESGSAASAYLENAEEEQYKKLKSLDYIKYVGQEYTVGNWYQNNKLLANCKVIDETAYEKIIKPTYDDIKGHYPSDTNEIMLSKRLLQKLGISNPQLGMKISIPILFDSWSVNDGNELTEEFILVGYYNDYIDEVQYVPVAYLSEKYLESKQISRYPVRLSIIFKSGFLSNMQMEQKLYQDVELENAQQQFSNNGSAEFRSVNQLIGGYGVAFLCTIIVLLSVYLLIYNVFSISLAKDIHYYGLLLVIGTTQKQLRKLIASQNRAILIKGILLGSVLSLLVGSVGFPILFKGLFFLENREISIDTVLYPEILIGAVMFVIILMLSASNHVLGKLKKMSPVEAYKYQAKTVSHRKHTESPKGTSICRMAWYNFSCSKRKTCITLISLFIGCEMALLSSFISNGTDVINRFLQQPDFEIGTKKDAVDAYLFPYSTVDELQVDREKSLLDEALMEKIIGMDEVDEDSIEQIYGCYATFDYNEEFIQPKVNAAYGTGTSNNVMTIQVVDDQYIQELQEYAERNQLNVDIASLKNGTGILALHKHELSEMLEDDANQMVGESVHVYPMETMDMSEAEGIEFVCSGYIDTTLKDFPQLSMSWNGEGVNYFLVSKQGYERLNYPKQVFSFTFDARNGQEAIVKEKLTQLIQEENSKQEAFDIYYLSCTSDKIREVKNYRNNSRVVMIALCLSLSLLGITNYINIITTNIAVRKKDFIIMEKIGMTHKQLKKMLIMESLYHWGILIIILLSVGTLMTVGIGYIIKNTLSYFSFSYPIKEFFIIAIILLTFCVFVPQVFLKEVCRERKAKQKRDY